MIMQSFLPQKVCWCQYIIVWSLVSKATIEPRDVGNRNVTVPFLFLLLFFPDR